MRKSLLILSLIGSLNIVAQENFGVFGGIGATGFTDSDSWLLNRFSGTPNRFSEIGEGIHLGILYNHELSDKIAFRPKLTYSQRGDRHKNDRISLPEVELQEIDIKLNYLDVSPEFKFWSKAYIIAGPKFSFLLSEKRMSFHNINLKSKFDYGFTIGGGFSINDLFFELNIYQGLKNLATLPDSIQSDGKNNVRNASIKLSLGYNL